MKPLNNNHKNSDELTLGTINGIKNVEKKIAWSGIMDPEEFDNTDFLALADKTIFNHLKGNGYLGDKAYAYLDRTGESIPVEFTVKVGRLVKKFTIKVDRKVFHRAHWDDLVYTPGLFFQMNDECHRYWRFVNAIKDYYSKRFYRSLSDEEAIGIFNAIEKGFADGSLKA